jgi:hypothetical protein
MRCYSIATRFQWKFTSVPWEEFGKSSKYQTGCSFTVTPTGGGQLPLIRTDGSIHLVSFFSTYSLNHGTILNPFPFKHFPYGRCLSVAFWMYSNIQRLKSNHMNELDTMKRRGQRPIKLNFCYQKCSPYMLALSPIVYIVSETGLHVGISRTNLILTELLTLLTAVSNRLRRSWDSIEQIKLVLESTLNIVFRMVSPFLSTMHRL